MSSLTILYGLRRLTSVSAPVLQSLNSLIESCHQQTQYYQHQPFSSTTLLSSASKPLHPGVFFNAVRDSGIQFFCGVPDSLLKDFCAYVTKNSTDKEHIITANEGAAVGLAAGYHLASGKTAMVYLQNSGLGNMVNPIMSLANPTVYSLPILFLIGWRGEPGVKDEPQHVAQGRITMGLLNCMEIPSEVLSKSETEMRATLQRAEEHFREHKSPFAILVKTKTFSGYTLPLPDNPQFPLTREEALFKVVECLKEEDAIVGTTGMLSRELFEYRVTKQMGHARDFLTVGSMGHASSIALGIALQRPNRQIFCLDGDGAVLMHMGTLATIGQQGPENFKHIVFNNGAHDSVGGQPTEAANHDDFDLCSIARGCGYREVLVASTAEDIEEKVKYLHKAKGPIFLELKVKLGSRSNVGRPTRTTIENKEDFMEFLQL
jgi:phosphonopyruvate decarboxylase